MNEKKARKAVTDILLDIGAGEHLTGFPMLVDAIVLWMDVEHRHIYKALAAKYDCTVQMAERRIRQCIVYAFRNSDQKILNGYLYGAVPAYQVKTPNYVFIARIARIAWEKLEWGEADGD